MFGKQKLVPLALSLALAATTLLGTVGSVSAQSAYVKTFDLSAKPSTDGAYAGVDPSGANVTFWHAQSGANGTKFKAIVDQFNKNNPWKITIDAQFKGNYDTIYQGMLAGLQTKEVPNLMQAYQNQAAQYQNVNGLVDLNDFVNDKTYGLGADLTGDFYQGFLQSDVNPQFNNQRLGFPLFRSAEVMYYNVDALKSVGITTAPKTWDDFKTAACAYSKTGGGHTGFEIRTDASFIAGSAFGQGGDIYDYANNKFTLDTPEVEAMPQVMQDLYTQGCASLIANPSAYSDQNDFATSKSLFYAGTTAGIFYVGDAINKSGKPFAWDIAPDPYKASPVVNVYGASVSIPKSTKQQELAAWLFVRWFSEPDQQAAWAQASYYFPVRKSTATGLADFFTKNPQYKHAFDLLANSKGEPPISAYTAVRPLLSNALNDVIDGKPVSDTFSQLNDDAATALSKDKPGAPLPTPKPTVVPTAASAATMAPTAAK